jgi:hypothetical protein
MKTITAALLLTTTLACSNPVDVKRIPQSNPASNVTIQAKPTPSLVIEKISGDCATGITVRVTGTNLSARSRFGNQWLNLTDLTSLGPAQVALGTGSKKSVEWTTFWPASVINPATGAKFNGYARGVVTDSWTGWLHQTSVTFIGPAC